MNAGPKSWRDRISGVSLAAFWFAFAFAMVQPVYGQATYTLTGEITGSLGETEFENAPFTWTLLGNPADITTPKHPTQFQLDGTESDIDIAGIGDAIFQETILVQADQRSGHGDTIFVDTNDQEGIGVVDPTDVDAWLQPLATSFGPITGSPEYESASGLSTSLGTFIVDGVQDVSFQETVSPEPATFALVVIPFLAAVVVKRRRRLQSA